MALMARWKLDETSGTTVADSSGNGNNGVASAAGWTQHAKVYRSGVKGAFDTAAGTKHISVTGDLYGYATTFQLKAWVRRNVGGGGVVWSDRDSQSAGLRLKISAAGIVDMSYRNAGGDEYNQIYLLTVPELMWTQIVWRLTQVNMGGYKCIGELFVNTVKDSVYTVDNDNDGGQCETNGKIGVDYDGITNPFKGIIDDVEFADPQTDGEIAAQYAAEIVVPPFQWKTQAQETQYKFTADAILPINLEFELPRNKFNTGSSVADLLTGKSVKLLNVDNNGTSDKKYSDAEEQTRNTPDKTKYEKDAHFNKWGTDTVGEYEGGVPLPVPSSPALGTPDVLSSTSLRIYFTWSANATKIYLERSADGGVTWGTAIEMSAGAYYCDDSGLTVGHAYLYRARAWNASGYSFYSTSVTATTRTTNQIEQALWAAYKTKMRADTYLASYISLWKFDKAEKILAESKTPVFKSWILDTSEDWKGIPKSKIVRCHVVIHGIVKVKSSVDLETEKLKFDEYVKNAIEADMTFAGAVTMNVVGDTIFSNLDDSTGEIFITCEILSGRFTAGAR